MHVQTSEGTITRIANEIATSAILIQLYIQALLGECCVTQFSFVAE